MLKFTCILNIFCLGGFMGIKKFTSYTFGLEGETFPLPFNPESDPEHTYISENGLKAVLAFLVRDESPEDPFEMYDEGEFYQFDRRRIHDVSRPDIEEFKRVVRANPGRVVTADSCGDGYRVGELVTVADCRNFKTAKYNKRGDSCRAETLLDRADGYYIVPEDATDPFKYAQGALETYSQWCNGEVYGVCVWTYTRESIADQWDDPKRDECWGYYGHDGYTADELLSQFRYAVTNGDPSKENSD
jgi:hypothetical protein